MVLLHLLVSRIPEPQPALQHGVHRQLRVDSLPGCRAGKRRGRVDCHGLPKLGLPVTAARKSAVTVAALMMTMAIPAVLAQSPAVSIAFVSVAMAGYTAALANMLAMPADVFPPQAVASVYGLASMGAGFGGMVFMLITGWLVDRYSYAPAFLLFGLIPLVCASILWTFTGPLTQQVELTELTLRSVRTLLSPQTSDCPGSAT